MRVEWNLAFTPEAERPYVVQAQNVVSVRVRIKHRVKPLDLFSNRLLAEIRRGVNQHRVAVVFHQHRRAQSPVMRIVRRAYAAVAPNGRNAHGRSAAQHGESRLHFLSSGGTAPGGMAPGLVAEVATAFVISIKAMRSSNSTFCSSVFSRSVRLPFVFSCRIASESIVCRAPIMSTRGGSLSCRIAPIWISALM